VAKIERLEAENKRLQEKMNDLQFYKSRVDVSLIQFDVTSKCLINTYFHCREWLLSFRCLKNHINSPKLQELSHENTVLQETKSLLSGQVDEWRQRAQQHATMEAHYGEVQRQIQLVQAELRTVRPIGFAILTPDFWL
jgi:hypothetical protein